jgi:2-(3-amino-3-carboxypropyl)histidine synthase
MGDSTEESQQNPSLRQPKKRFVGRRTADAQAQSSPSVQDVESTSIQKGMQPVLPISVEDRQGIC